MHRSLAYFNVRGVFITKLTKGILKHRPSFWQVHSKDSSCGGLQTTPCIPSVWKSSMWNLQVLLKLPAWLHQSCQTLKEADILLVFKIIQHFLSVRWRNTINMSIKTFNHDKTSDTRYFAPYEQVHTKHTYIKYTCLHAWDGSSPEEQYRISQKWVHAWTF